jgi:hypothetical protein
MQNTTPYICFFVLALIAAVISIIGFDVFARMQLRFEPFQHAINKSLYYSRLQIIGTIMLIAPFIAVGLYAAVTAKKGNSERAWYLLAGGLIPLIALYLNGYLDASECIMQKKWTASALAVGLLPFQSVPAIPVGMFIGHLIWKKFRKKEI